MPEVNVSVRTGTIVLYNLRWDITHALEGDYFDEVLCGYVYVGELPSAEVG